MATTLSDLLCFSTELDNPEVFPEGVGAETWQAHVAEFLTAWLADFSWRGAPITRLLGHMTLTVRTESGQHVLVGTVRGTPFEPSARQPTRAAVLAAAALDDWRNPLWWTLIDEWKLAGRWLHPDMANSLDPMVWQQNRAVLPIGCLDASNPTAPRRFDPSKQAWCHDLGVIDFPARIHRVFDLLARGFSPGDAVEAAACMALLEAGVHEAMEMFDLRGGKPAWSPHTKGTQVLLDATFETQALGVVLQGTAT